MMSKNRTKSEDKRRLILKAAVRLFVEHGFTQVTMAKIAEQAGVAKQTVYSHFGNKEDLFGAAVEYKCASLKLSETLLQGDQDVETSLVAFAKQFGAFIIEVETVNTHTLCAFEAKHLPQLADIFFRLGPDTVITALSQFFSFQHQQGVLNVPQPRWAASQFLGMVMGEARLRAELNQMDDTTLAEREQYLVNCVALFLNFYRT
ncbi:TetR/AcrR family transcriptional regulator [Motilimonas eburnea]|uniref:TetR/AcrR family transcriptional regulator n=1 Tax=Motilimonas eburnea TaxID=1737488 RepID=UPI001E3C184A|nr:TetR/AcrR family transcriptional regulator [Motilimonas eburnea]MCE2573559.1 TetR/AcrR family transcriptional regulator [Motilimonas eburnea]